MNIRDNQRFWDRLENIDQIIIMGSSITVDFPYYEHMNMITADSKPEWVFYQYGNDDGVGELSRLVKSLTIKLYPDYLP